MGLDQYAYVKSGAEEGAEPVFIWRKHARLQEFMESLFEFRTGQGRGDLNCGELELTAEDIDMLAEKVAGGALPESPGGFFYGHQFQDEQAAAYRDRDLQFCDWARAQIEAGETVCFSRWW